METKENEVILEALAKGFDYKLAARIVQNKNAVSQDDLDDFVLKSRKIFDEWKKQVSEIGELKRKLAIAEQEISFLQVTK